MTERPLGRDELNDLMAPFGPFEPAPHIAVAVSGGADSMALALLLSDWAAARTGACTALIVDHGLRPEARREASWAAAALTARGVTARLLTWCGAKPTANLQAAARAARYRLLGEWCRRHGVLHLALAHHLDDQAETLLLRLARGSGLDGLAAMAPISEHADFRVLRPLLTTSKARLVATLRAHGQDWTEDPSNQDRKHARIRLRQLLPELAGEGLSPDRLAATAGRLGQARGALEQALAALLARAVVLDPAGFAWLDPQMIGQSHRELGLRALSRLLMTLGGGAYGPRLSRLEGLYERMIRPDFRGATLAGCRLLPRREGILVVREITKIDPKEVFPGQKLLWDGRFEITLSRARQKTRRPMILAALGRDGWRRFRASARVSGQVPSQAIEKSRFPSPALLSLPALWVAGEPVSVPHLGIAASVEDGVGLKKCTFRPKNGLIGTWFTVA